MKRICTTIILLVATLMTISAEGRRESPYPTLREGDRITIASDAPLVTIDRHGRDDTMHVQLSGRGSNRYHLTVRNERDGVSVEVKKKQRLGVFLSDLFDARLDISIPESWTKGELDVKTISGALKIEKSLEAHRIALRSVSGSIGFTALSATDRIEIESVSGAIRGSNVEAAALELSSVSGAIMIDRIAVFNGKEDLQVDTVSGAIKLGETSAGNAKIQSVSGSILLTLKNRFEGKVSATSISGSISAEISNEHTKWSEKRTQGFSIGSGHNLIEIGTASGSIRIIQ